MIQRIKSKALELCADLHLREVARGTLLTFALKLCGSGLAFLFNVAVARLLGAEGAGLYFLALSITTIATVIGSVGLNNALLRFIAVHATHKEWGKVKGVYALSMRIAIVSSGSLALLGFVLAPWLSEVLFQKPLLTEALRCMSLSILPFTLLNLQAQSFKGLKNIRDAMLVQGIGVPFISLLLIYPLAQFAGLKGVALANLIATILVSGLGYWAWHKLMMSYEELPVKHLFIDLWSNCKHLLIVALAGEAFLPFAPTLFLGLWETSEEIGIFGAASRVAMLVSFLLVAVNNVLAPKFAELYAKGEMDALGKVVRRTAGMVILLVSPIFLLLIFRGHWVMSIFGPKFDQGTLVLSILVIGQMVNLMTGSVGYLLVMTGNEKIFKNVTVWSVILMAVLSVVLIPVMGNIGAALASAGSQVFLNIASACYIKKMVGIQPIPLLR